MDAHLDIRRIGRITGSRVAAILGVSPYQSRAEVLRAMVREHHGASSEFTGNEATRWGQEHEPVALAEYEAAQGLMTHGGGELVIHPQHDFLAVTPDGLVGDDGMVEVKCPYRGSWRSLAEASYYAPQIQLQLACTGRDWCDFVIWRPADMVIERVWRDGDWLDRHLPALLAFASEYEAALDDPSHLQSAEREDGEWAMAAKAWAKAKQAAEQAEADLDAARARLIELAASKPARGCGVQVVVAERKGSIAYAKALAELAPGADLSKWAGKPSQVIQVREATEA